MCGGGEWAGAVPDMDSAGLSAVDLRSVHLSESVGSDVRGLGYNCPSLPPGNQGSSLSGPV